LVFCCCSCRPHCPLPVANCCCCWLLWTPGSKGKVRGHSHCPARNRIAVVECCVRPLCVGVSHACRESCKPVQQEESSKASPLSTQLTASRDQAELQVRNPQARSPAFLSTYPPPPSLLSPSPPLAASPARLAAVAVALLIVAPEERTARLHNPTARLLTNKQACRLPPLHPPPLLRLPPPALPL
jgi:hypothetical protein